MRRSLKVMVAGLMIAGVITTGSVAYATNTTTSSAAETVTDTEYSLEEMLVYAIEDEYLAQAEYDAIMDEYGTQRPYSNIINAEAYHIDQLVILFEAYDITVPEKDWESMIKVPESLEAGYEIGVAAEEKNIAMYGSFLKEELSDDVKIVFENLLNASENHLRSFQNALDGNLSCGGQNNRNSGNAGCGQGNGMGRSRNQTNEGCGYAPIN